MSRDVVAGSAVVVDEEVANRDVVEDTTTDDQQVTGPRHYRHLIDGRERESEEVIERRAPATGRVVAVVQAGAEPDVDLAVTAARTAFDSGPWPRMPGSERAAVLRRAAELINSHSDELARLDAEEGGKPIRLAAADITGAVGLTTYAAGLAEQLHGSLQTNNGPDFTGLVIREPVGVVGLIVPWNFPALILSQKLPFALAAGCTVVVKPSELTTGSAVEIAKLYREAGLPDGVLNLVTGDGRAGQALAEHAGVDLLSFTGSTATGRRVVHASAKSLKRTALELGGKAASIVFADADLDDALEGVTFGAFFNNGECCVSQSRLLVESSIAEDFLTELGRRAGRLVLGQPLDPRTDVGPMIHQAHLDKVLGYLADGRQTGARVVTGGGRAQAAGLAAGQFVQPTILAGVTAQQRVFTEEIFGPVLTVTTFDGVDEALRLANCVDYGLSNSIWTKNLDTALNAAKALRSGTVYVNTAIDAPPTMPFGGYKSSGYGREMGQAGFEEFTELKSINIRTGARTGHFAVPDPAAARQQTTDNL